MNKFSCTLSVQRIYYYWQRRIIADAKNERRTKICWNKNKRKKTYKIDEESLLEEILITIREFFSCTMAQKENQAIFTFENGQRFRICVQEIGK